MSNGTIFLRGIHVFIYMRIHHLRQRQQALQLIANSHGKKRLIRSK